MRGQPADGVDVRAHRDALAEQGDLVRAVDQPAAERAGSLKAAMTTAHRVGRGCGAGGLIRPASHMPLAEITTSPPGTVLSAIDLHVTKRTRKRPGLALAQA